MRCRCMALETSVDELGGPEQWNGVKVRGNGVGCPHSPYITESGRRDPASLGG